MKNLVSVGLVISVAVVPALAGPFGGRHPGTKSPSPTIEPVGPGIPGTSWSQGWNFIGGDVDFFAVRVTGTLFQSSGVSDFSVAGWSEIFRDSSDATVGASGASTGNLLFSTWFEGDITDPITLDFAFFVGNELSALRREWLPSQSQWAVGAADWTPQRSDFSLIPLPSAGIAGFAGLLLLASRRRR